MATTTTSTSSGTNAQPTSRDRTMGLGNRLRAALEKNKVLQETVTANQDGENTPPPPPPTETESFQDGIAYAYITLNEGDLDDLTLEDMALAGNYLDEAAVSISPTDPDAALGMFELYALLSEGYFGKEAYEKTDAALQKGIGIVDEFLATSEDTDDREMVSYEVGYILYDFNYPSLAIDYFYTSLEEDPGDADNAYMLATCLALNDQSDEALTFLEYALKLGYHLGEDATDIDSDEDFDSIRYTEAYQALKKQYGF
ncbi:MAG: tetratricopeptide repeat protein [Bacteroidota bacterium]